MKANPDSWRKTSLVKARSPKNYSNYYATKYELCIDRNLAQPQKWHAEPGQC